MSDFVRLNIPGYAAMAIVYARESGQAVFENHDLKDWFSGDNVNPAITSLLNGRAVGPYLTSQSTNQNNLLGLTFQEGRQLKRMPEEVMEVIMDKELFYNDGEFCYLFADDNELDCIYFSILTNWLKLSGINKFIYDSANGLMSELIARAEEAGIIKLVSRNSGNRDDYDMNQSVATRNYLLNNRYGEEVLVKRIRQTIEFSDVFNINGDVLNNADIVRNILNKLAGVPLVASLMELDMFISVSAFLNYIENNVD